MQKAKMNPHSAMTKIKDPKIWATAQKKHRLSNSVIQMAKELGLNPKKFGKLDNHKQEPWKAPLSVFIKELYQKRLDKTARKKSISPKPPNNDSLPPDTSSNPIFRR